MIAELVPGVHDTDGTRVHKPDRRLFRPSHPVGRYVSQPLKETCKDLEELRRFLCTCEYVSDEEQFGKADYWLPPEEFEATRKGDCEDFALWTWRQLLAMGYAARFVAGVSGRYGEGHAWVMMTDGGRDFLVEPLACHLGQRLPRLSVVRYQPITSVSWDGSSAAFFHHHRNRFTLNLFSVAPLVLEWTAFWAPLWAKVILGLALLPVSLPVAILKRVHAAWTGRAAKKVRNC